MPVPAPLPGLRDGTLLLRAWGVADAAWYIAARDEEIFRWTSERRDLTLAEAEQAIRQANAGGAAVCYAIADGESGALLGNLALVLEGEPPTRGEVMYWLAPAARGQGTAARAARLLCGWAFETLHLEAITLKTLPGNLASQRTARAAGFRKVEAPAEGAAQGSYVWFELRREQP